MFSTLFKHATSEEKLLNEVQRGDDSAMSKLYHLHVRYLTALCSRYISNDEDVKDVLQESFVKIFSSIHDFEYRGKGSVRAWMAKVTLNEALKFVRQSHNEVFYVEIDEAGYEVADEEMQTEEIPTEVLYHFIRELPEGYRTVFNLYVVEGKSHKEIAALLNVKENTSATQFRKAKMMLAQKIKQYRNDNSI